MNKRRLLKLADLLEADAKNKKGIKFDLRVIACHSKPVRPCVNWWDDDPRQILKTETPTADCGTAACAIGLAIISGAFKRSGLSYVIGDFGPEPKFNGRLGFGIADRKFFELSHDEHEFLFEAHSYSGAITGAPGELNVAKRIRDFVAGKIAP